MVEPRLQILRPPLPRGVAREGHVAELIAIMVGARMPPRPDHQVQHVGALVAGLERAIDRGGAVAVLLVPLANLEHRRHGQRPRRKPFVDGLQLPEVGVGRVLHHLAHERHLVDAPLAREIAG